MKKEKGITLIALIVTIVVLLILASISIKVLTGDNGLINQAKNGKDASEISEEKEIVNIAVTQTIGKDKLGDLSIEGLQKELDKQTGEGKTEVSDAGEKIEVCFIEKKRYYEVDKEGKVSDEKYPIDEKNAGDITKDGKCDGSKDKPYEINCIEDLVVLSNIVRGKGIKFEKEQAIEITKADDLQEKYVVLKRSLNFKSKYSYKDSTRTDFGNINGDDTDGNSLITEMTTGAGFIPIGYDNEPFRGNFDGNEHEILNLYIDAEKDDKSVKGLFGFLSGKSNISNLTVTGKIKSNWHAGGIAAEAHRYANNNYTVISNCISKVDIIGYNMVGGIAGFNITKIENCKNYGTLEITGASYQYGGIGGIIGVANNSENEVQISNCINYGDIKGMKTLGGIAGTSTGNTNIINCKNKGGVIGSFDAGGILGWQRGGNLNILNCNNEGEALGKGSKGGLIGYVGGAGWDAILVTNIYNCYNIGSISSSDGSASGIVGYQGTVSAQNYLYIKNSWNLGKLEGKTIGYILGKIETSTKTETKTEFENVYCTNTAIGTGTLTGGDATQKTGTEIKSQSFVDLLNSNIGTNTEWKKWKVGENGYPVFE